MINEDYYENKQRLLLGYDSENDEVKVVNVDLSGNQIVSNKVWDIVTLSWVAMQQPVVNTDVLNVNSYPEPKYSMRIDEVSEDLIYIGEALPGSSESSSVWRIKQITPTGVLFADGNTNFDNRWDQRASLSYS